MLPNEILYARWPRAVQRLVGIQGDPPTPQLAPEIQPTIELLNAPPELRYLLGEKLASRFFSVTGDATHPATVQLYNPPGSGLLVVVEGWYLMDADASTPTCTALAEIRDANGATVAATETTGQHRDTRWNPAVAGAVIRTATADAAGGVILGYFKTGMGFTPFPYILVPGTWLSLYTHQISERLLGTVMWRERYLPPLEERSP